MGVVILGVLLFIYIVVATITTKTSKKYFSDYIPNDLKILLIFASFPVMYDIIEGFSFDAFIVISEQQEQWWKLQLLRLYFYGCL